MNNVTIVQPTNILGINGVNLMTVTPHGDGVVIQFNYEAVTVIIDGKPYRPDASNLKIMVALGHH